VSQKQIPRLSFMSSTLKTAAWRGLFLSTILLALAVALCAQTILNERKEWHASWISHPTAPLREPGVFHFRKSFALDAKPDHFIVLVSGDNRFQLFVNGQRAGEGPARGDLAHWRYETLDLAPFLHTGDNLIAATVWQFGIRAPLAQISDRLAFLVEGNTTAESIVNTDSSWQVEEAKDHTVRAPLPPGMWQYYAAGPGEQIDFKNYNAEWNKPGSTTGHWVAAAPAMRESKYPQGSIPVPRSVGNGMTWLPYPDPLPQMEYQELAPPRVARSTVPDAQKFPQSAVVIPSNTQAAVLLDQGEVVSAYPQLMVSGGKGARIELVYTEALYDQNHARSQRDAVGDLAALGLTDVVLPDGGPARSFMPLWWRTWRFLELKIQTAAEPLQLDSARTFFTGFPFVERGSFKSSDPELARIREISWRTARVDAHETYMDTAYWEQLQYFGDTRIQALISYVVSGDDRLARQALEAADDSRIPGGLTQSRYPSSLQQLIPPFSLIYVNMLHDFWFYRPDPQFVATLLPGTRSVLAWFLRQQRNDGFLGPLPYWNFVDWVGGDEKFPTFDDQGRSSILTLQLIGSLRDAADMEEALGDPSLASAYRKKAQLAAESVYRQCWNAKLGLLADTPEQLHFSQHANALAVIYDVVPALDQPSILRRFLGVDTVTHAGTPKLTPASYYFQFYVSRALEHAGLGDLYLDTLQPWRQMLAKGFTTTPETPDPSRSDTHAWSGHPAFDLNTMVAGIRPSAPAFASVRIRPALGKLAWVEASTPHPEGLIRTSYKRIGDKIEARIELPGKLTGLLVWKEKEYPLHPGEQKFELK
jgi:alpha-L-rhamnosidase